jgi:hypothetical protein
MLNDLDRIRLLAILYGSPDPAGPSGASLPQWTTLIHSLLGPVGHILDGTTHNLFFPGSKFLIDWWLDFDAVPIEMAKFGLVHPGFMAKPLALKSQLDKLVGNAPVVTIGHSLGAADAQDYAALRLAEGLQVKEIVAFGSPMPGCQEMKDLLAPVPMQNYRNELAMTETIDDFDPVTTKPFPIPVIFPCLQMRDFIRVRGGAAPGDASDFRLHHAARYYAGLMLTSRAFVG